MRDILFRGKRKDNNDWVYGGIVHQTDFYGDKCDKWFIIDGTDTQDYDIGYEYEVIPESVGQFTGLYDKNNVRIFEGDIVKTVRYSNRINYWIVKFDCGSFYFVDGENRISPSTFDFDYADFSEVVGNIFENKEFLKEEN